MSTRIFVGLGVVLAGLIAVVVAELPELRRYMKIRSM
jgi:hypothetical protein